MLNICLPTPGKLNRSGRKQTGAKLALKPFQVWGIRIRLQVADGFRDLALFDLALDSKLRGCDLTALNVPDLLSATGVGSRVTVLRQKNGRSAQRSPSRFVADRLFVHSGKGFSAFRSAEIEMFNRLILS